MHHVQPSPPNNKPARLALAQFVCGLLPPVAAPKVAHVLYPYARARRDAYAFVTSSCTGSYFANNTVDCHAHHFSMLGYYDWRQWAIAAAVCEPGDTIVEVGANIGTETVGFADIVGPDGRVYAFEPSSENAEMLGALLRNAGLSQVVLVRAAVADTPGAVEFVKSAVEGESGIGHIRAVDEEAADSLIAPVDCTTLDAFFADEHRIRLISIDAEGAEAAILRGAREVILRDRPAIIVEAESRNLDRSGASLADLALELADNGYVIRRIGRLGLTIPSFAASSAPANWLCVHESDARLIPRVASEIRRCGLLPCVAHLNPLGRLRRSKDR